jgi:hypothetical protein
MDGLLFSMAFLIKKITRISANTEPREMRTIVTGFESMGEDGLGADILVVWVVLFKQPPVLSCQKERCVQ